MSRKQSCQVDLTKLSPPNNMQRTITRQQPFKKYHVDFDKYPYSDSTTSQQISYLSPLSDFSTIKKLPQSISNVRETFSYNPSESLRQEIQLKTKPNKSKNQRLSQLVNIALDLKIVKEDQFPQYIQSHSLRLEHVSLRQQQLSLRQQQEPSSKSQHQILQKLHIKQDKNVRKYSNTEKQIKSYKYVNKPYNYDKSHSVTVEQQIQKIRQENLQQKRAHTKPNENQQHTQKSRKISATRRDKSKDNFMKKNYVQYYSPKIEKFSNIKNFEGVMTLSPSYERKKDTSFEFKNDSPPKSPTFSMVKKLSINKSVQKVKQKILNEGVKIQDFDIIKTLGKGRFGIAYLAYHKTIRGVFAIKKIKKQTIIANKMIDQFILEVKLQTFLTHPFILKIYSIFDDQQHIYLVMQYLQQGCLFNYLKNSKNKKLTQSDTAEKIKYLAESIKYLQDHSIAHRDIKPQNIIMTYGVCKLADFGWATFCDEQRRKTYCGTCDYVAPEILQGQQYDESVDLWCIGVLAYELMVGKPPFYHMSQKQTRNKIMNINLTFPEDFTEDIKSFISGLIQKDPQQRMSIEEVLMHPFLKNVNLCE